MIIDSYYGEERKVVRYHNIEENILEEGIESKYSRVTNQRSSDINPSEKEGFRSLKKWQKGL